MPKLQKTIKPRSRASIRDTGVVTKSSSLKGKRLAIALTGGIACTEAVKIIREFRRHGATLTPFMTSDSLRFITALSIEWAAAEKAVIEVGPGVDTLDQFDAVIVAPATLNSIVKASLGIADSAVNLLIAGQIGKKAPLFFVPTMNEDLMNHPQYSVAKEVLIKWGAQFFEQALEENRLKMPDAIQVADWVMKELKNVRKRN